MSPLLRRHTKDQIADNAWFEFWADVFRAGHPALSIEYVCGTHRRALKREIPVDALLDSRTQSDNVAKFCQGITTEIGENFRKVVGQDLHPDVQGELEDRAIKFGKAITMALRGGSKEHFADRFADEVGKIPKGRITLSTSSHRRT